MKDILQKDIVNLKVSASFRDKRLENKKYVQITNMQFPLPTQKADKPKK